MNWHRVNQQTPCGVCQKTDWCTIGAKGWCCMRVDSKHALSNGGWFHPFDKKVPVPQLAPKNHVRISAPVDFDALMAALPNNPFMITRLAAALGTNRSSLLELNCNWSFYQNAFAFPMRDEFGNTIGIRYRGECGFKWAEKGSRNGLFVPSAIIQDVALITEGPTSTAAALTLGYYAIGRPSCSCGGEMVRDTLRRLGIRKAIIVADNDNKRRPDGSDYFPGTEGAEKLAKEIKCSTKIWTPPVKDIRVFLNAGGTRQMIEDELKNLKWRFS